MERNLVIYLEICKNTSAYTKLMLYVTFNCFSDYRNIEKNTEKMSSITGLDIKKLKAQIEKNSLVKYFIDGPMYSDEKLGKQGIDAIDTIYSLERLIEHINKNGHNAAETSFQTEKPIDLNNVNFKPSPSIPGFYFT